MSITPYLICEKISHDYCQEQMSVPVLKGVSFSLHTGEKIALTGVSGSGKSTLLHLLGLLMPIQTGSLTLGGRTCPQLTDTERTRIRRDDLGFIYQFHHLLPELTVLENVALPQRILGVPWDKAKEKARALLSRVFLDHRLQHLPSQLSGGEQQRTAIARALVNNPRLLLADEPTGSLDSKTGNAVTELMLDIATEHTCCLIIATHNPHVAKCVDKTLHLEGGSISS
jgi:lipoprotein-releasing system ATP-binding protein